MTDPNDPPAEGVPVDMLGTTPLTPAEPDPAELAANVDKLARLACLDARAEHLSRDAWAPVDPHRRQGQQRHPLPRLPG